jgi:hypothetical protein
MDSLAQLKLRENDMRFGSFKVRSLHRTHSLKTVARELGMYKLELLGVKEVRWEKGSTERAEGYTFSCAVANEVDQLETGSSYIRESYQ